MGFDLIHEDDPVRLGGQPVAVEGRPVWQCAVLHHLHGRTDRHSRGLLCDSVVREDLFLPLCRGAAVAPHSGYDKGFSSQILKAATDCPQDQGEVGYPPATGRYADPPAPQGGSARQLSAQSLLQVGFYRVITKELPDASHLRQLDCLRRERNDSGYLWKVNEHIISPFRTDGAGPARSPGRH